MKPRSNPFSRSAKLATAIAFCLCAASIAHAATFYWDGTTGNWSDLTKWSTDLAGTTDPTTLPLATVVDTLNFNTTPGAASSSILYLDGNRGSGTITARLNFSTGSATTTTLLGGVSGSPANNDLYFTTNLTVNAGSGAVTIGDTAASPTAKVNLKIGTTSFTNNSASLLTLANGINSFGSSSNTNFTFTGSGNILASGVIGNGTGTNKVVLNKSGTGTMTLNGSAVNTFTGNIAVNGGTLSLDFANLTTPTNLVNSVNALTLGGGTLSTKGKSSGATAQTLGNLTLTASTGSTIALNPNSGSGTTLTLGNTWTRGANSTLLIDLSLGGTLTSSPTPTNSVLGYAIVKDATSAGFATVSGGNVVRYTGATALVDTSDSSTTNYSYSGSGATLNWSNGITNRSVNSLAIDTSGGSAIIDMGAASNVLTLTSGGLLMTGANNATIQNGQVGAGGSDVVINQFGAGTLTISGTISGGAGTLAKAGPGTLILSNTNTYTGATTVSGGTLSISSNANLGAVATGATLNLSGGTLKATSTFALDNAGANKRNVVLTNANTIDTVGNTLTVSGVISGTGSLTKVGSGQLTLSNTNTYTGATVVDDGILALSGGNTGNSGLYTSSEITINNGGQVLVTGDNALHGYSSTAGPVTINAGGEMTAANGVTAHIRGALVLNGGELASTGIPDATYGSWTLNVGDVTATGTATSTISATQVNWTGTRTFTVVEAAGKLDVTGTFDRPGGTMTGALTKAGEGTMVLGGVNTYTGATQVNAGKLIVNGSTASASAVTVASGATLGGTGTVGGTLAVTGILAPGDGGIESLDVTNTVTWKGAASAAAATIWQFDLGASNTADLLNITGDFTKDTSVGTVFGFNFMNSNVNGTFKLVDWSATTNFLASDFSYTNLGGGRTGTFSFNGSSLEFTAVPEPTSALAGLLITAGLLRRRRHA